MLSVVVMDTMSAVTRLVREIEGSKSRIIGYGSVPKSGGLLHMSETMFKYFLIDPGDIDSLESDFNLRSATTTKR